jgi:hypothetical protein
MMGHIRLSLVLLAWSCSSIALAHKPSDSYLRIHGGQQQLSVQWDIALKDLEFLIGLDADRDGEITWGELKAQQEAIAAHALSRLHVTADGRECDLQLAKLLVNQHSDGAYAVLELASDGPGNAKVLSIQYSLLFDADPTHRGLVLYASGPAVSTNVIGPDDPPLELRSGDVQIWQAFVDYVREGVWHIWIGYDHILFLVSLLLPAVLVRRDDGWHAVKNFRPACSSVLKIVTVFTLAHSITLWLAVMGYVTLPSRFVEATIALSIVVTALNNLYPVLPFPGWAIAFVFGLVHGFGFANVLLDLGLSNTTLAVALLGFNVGVELGQLCIVLVFLPLAYLMRDTVFYRSMVLRAGSVMIAIAGGVWMVERVLNVTMVGV